MGGNWDSRTFTSENTSSTTEEVSDFRRSCKSKRGGSKGKWLWNRVKYQLVEYHSLPAYLRDNEFIVKHYRAEWPLKQIFLSIFTIHNETLNIWTHLLGFFLFLCLTVYTAMKVPQVVDLHHLPEVLTRAHLHRVHSEFVTCLPSMPHMADLQRLRDEFRASLPPMDALYSFSGWHVFELLSNCLPQSSLTANHNDLGSSYPTKLICVTRFSLDFHKAKELSDCASLELILLFVEWNVQHGVKEDLTNMVAPLLVRPITRWPFFAFLGGAMFCLLASSLCHLLLCHSERLSYVMLRLDYAGIAALISTSFYPPVYYSFMCYPFFCNLYMGFITILGVASVIVSLTPAFQKPEFRTVRARLFSGMGMFGIAPILHKLILHWNHPAAIHTTGYEALMGASYGLGALVYAARIPERWMPGKFDIAGHSHQLFHLLVVAGAYAHYRAGLVYLKWRDVQGC
ncbi:Heptahelical Transmembrane protein [Nymphaea thermarum]|nr:Heptahelical Transmembrane protein [Nymphaea thermarum]